MPPGSNNAEATSQTFGMSSAGELGPGLGPPTGAERNAESSRRLESAARNLRTEALPQRVGDRSPNIAIQEMGGARNSGDPAVNAMLSGVTIGDANSHAYAGPPRSESSSSSAPPFTTSSDVSPPASHHPALEAAPPMTSAGVSDTRLAPPDSNTEALLSHVQANESLPNQTERKITDVDRSKSVNFSDVQKPFRLEGFTEGDESYSARQTNRIKEDFNSGRLPVEQSEGLAKTFGNRDSVPEAKFMGENWKVAYNTPTDRPGHWNSVYENDSKTHLLKVADPGQTKLFDQAGALQRLHDQFGFTIPQFKLLVDGKQTALLMEKLRYWRPNEVGDESAKTAAQAAKRKILEAGRLLGRQGYSTDMGPENWGVSQVAMQSNHLLVPEDIIVFDPVN